MAFGEEQEQQQEQEEQQEKEQEQQQQKEQEQEVEEPEVYAKEKYSREDEYETPWLLSQLAAPPSDSVQGFYPAADFTVGACTYTRAYADSILVLVLVPVLYFYSYLYL